MSDVLKSRITVIADVPVCLIITTGRRLLLPVVLNFYLSFQLDLLLMF